MLEEKKCINNEEICEEKQETRKLTDAELKQVNSGSFVGPTAVKLPGFSNSWV